MRGKVAVEEHFVVPELEPYFAWNRVNVAARKPMFERLLDLDARLKEMDRLGIELAVLSLVSEGIQGEPDPGLAAARAATANEALAGIIDRHPGRFAGFAAVPLQDPAAAVAELERSVTGLGLKGVCVNGFTTTGAEGQGAVYYDAPQFLPFWQCVEALGVPLYLHPRYPLPAHRGIYDGHPELLGSTWGFSVETATHALRLITSGLFDRVPGLTVVLGHLGELLPFALSRMEERLKHVEGLELRKPVTSYLRENFYVSTSGNFHTTSLLGVLLELGADRILFAVDYPFEDMELAVEWFETLPISPADSEKIARDNAIRLLHLDV